MENPVRKLLMAMTLLGIITGAALHAELRELLGETGAAKILTANLLLIGVVLYIGSRRQNQGAGSQAGTIQSTSHNISFAK